MEGNLTPLVILLLILGVIALFKLVLPFSKIDKNKNSKPDVTF